MLRAFEVTRDSDRIFPGRYAYIETFTYRNVCRSNIVHELRTDSDRSMALSDMTSE